MKNIVFSVLVVFSHLIAFSNPHVEVSLNGEWRFLIDSSKIGEINGYVYGLPAFSRTVSVPHTWNIEPGSENYYGQAWYQKDFSISKEWHGKAVYLKFGAVYHDAVIFLNGKKIGEHLHAGYTPFIINISNDLVYGSSNSLVVRVDNSFSESNLPYKNSFDWTNDGGIIREVSLQISNHPSIKYVHITPVINLLDSTGTIGLTVKLNEEKISKVSIKLTCKERKSGKILFEQQKEINKGKEHFTMELECGKVIPWHFDNPFLYQMDVVVFDNNLSTDMKSVRVGFREIRLGKDAWYFNGEQIRLPGIEYMPGSNPQYGIAEPHTFVDSVVRKMKDLNIIITRFHWPQDEKILDLMDEYGILVQEELPWWQHPNKLTPQLLATAKLQLTEMIEEHYNHPCVFAWGISNEVFGSESKDNLQLKSFINNLDSTRMVNIVGNEIYKNLQNDPSLLGDLPTWNEYVGTWHGKHRDELPSMFEKIEPILENRPLLITENGLCEPVFPGGDTRRIDEMLFHVKEWCTRPFIIGYIYFCLNDYRTQMGEEGIGKYKIRRHGVTDLNLNPKASYSVLKQLCSPIEISKVAKGNNSDALVEIKVKNSIPAYILRNYVIVYNNLEGNMQEIQIPTLHPDDKIEVVLKNINQNYSFEIKRPTGFTVVKY